MSPRQRRRQRRQKRKKRERWKKASSKEEYADLDVPSLKS